MSDTPDDPKTPSARLARRRRLAAERARKSRERRAKARLPTPRKVDAALVDALRAALAQDQVFSAQDRTRTDAATVRVLDVMRVAVNALIREGHDREGTVRLITRRIHSAQALPTRSPSA